MPLIGTLTSGSLGAFGLAQQAQIAILKATTAISGSSFEFQQIVNSPAGSSLAGTNSSILGEGSFVAQGDYLLTGDGSSAANQNVYVWNLSDGSLHMSVPMPSPPDAANGWGFQIDIHGDYFIAGNGYDSLDIGRVTIHNVSTGALIKTLYGNARYVGISENYAVSISSSGNIHIFELATNTLRTFGHPNTGSGSKLMAVHGNNLILGFGDGSLVSVHDIPTAFANANLNTSSLTINPGRSFRSLEAEGNYLSLGVVAGSAQRILIYDLTTGTLLHDLDPPEGIGPAGIGDYIYPGFGNSVQISGDYLVAGYGRGAKGPVAVYDLTTGTLLQSFTIDDLPDTYSFVNEGNFGSSVAITDSKTIVGIRYHRAAGWVSHAEDGQGAFIIYSNPGQVAAPAVSADWSNTTLAYTIDNPNPYGTSEGDFFGYTMAISGDHAIVGALNEDDAGTNSGKAYIYNVTTGTLVHTINNPNAYGTSAGDTFGWSVAISGDRAIVSAYAEDDAGGIYSGKAYIYNVSTGALVHTLDNPNPYGTSEYDLFGNSVAISGDHAIVGAAEDDTGDRYNNSGKAYIYNVTTGALVHTINNPNAYGTSTGDLFGTKVAISGDRAIISAYDEGDAGGTNSGKAYIYNVTTGALVYTLDNPNAYDTSAGDKFGFSVSISGDYAIVGTGEEDDASGEKSGKAYIYNVTTGALVHTLDNPNPFGSSSYDFFGQAVAISGDYAIVTAVAEDELTSELTSLNSGKAYIYNVTSGALVKTLDNPNPYGTSENDSFGRSVGISDGRVIVGAPEEDDPWGTTSGKVYIFNAPEAAPASAEWSIDLSNVTYDNVSFSVVNQDESPQSIAFNNDGTKMYMIGSYWKSIYQYTLSTGFDLSTASYDNVNFNIESQDRIPAHLKFNTDGTKMYVHGRWNNKIHQYSLASGFDLSTTSYDNVTFDVPEFTYGFTFNNDGTKMYSNGDAGNLRQYSLTTGFDISTASYDNVNFATSQSSDPNDMWFNSAGTKMYILFSTSEYVMHQYSLTTGFDISTTSYDNIMFDIDAQDTRPSGTAISSDGTKMYMVSYNEDTVYQYSTGL